MLCSIDKQAVQMVLDALPEYCHPITANINKSATFLVKAKVNSAYFPLFANARPTKPHGITILWLVSNYTALQQRWAQVNNLLTAVTCKWACQENTS